MEEEDTLVTEAESNHSVILQILVNGDGYLDYQHTFRREIKHSLIWTRTQVISAQVPTSLAMRCTKKMTSA
jgi:hypothetical protein